MKTPHQQQQRKQQPLSRPHIAPNECCLLLLRPNDLSPEVIQLSLQRLYRISRTCSHGRLGVVLFLRLPLPKDHRQLTCAALQSFHRRAGDVLAGS